MICAVARSAGGLENYNSPILHFLQISVKFQNFHDLPQTIGTFSRSWEVVIEFETIPKCSMLGIFIYICTFPLNVAIFHLL